MAANEELIDKAKEVLADTFKMYMKAHSYHWNVTGFDFPQLHDFFGDMYEELHDAIDVLAEQIRQMYSFAPNSLARMIELSKIEEDTKILTPTNMINSLIEVNDYVYNNIKACYEMAEEQEEYCYSNILQDRLSAHAKHSWMLKAIANRKP